MTTNWTYNDGGREAAGRLGKAQDCVARAIAIVCEMPYMEAYQMVNALAVTEKPRNGKRKSSARTGVFKQTTRLLMSALCLEWVPTMKIGQGCKVHLKADELPKGRIICQVSKHVVAVIDGVIHDTYDCSRNGARCVYGYWKFQGQ